MFVRRSGNVLGVLMGQVSAAATRTAAMKMLCSSGSEFPLRALMAIRYLSSRDGATLTTPPL